MAVEDYSRTGLKGIPGLNARREPTMEDFLKASGIGVGGRGMNQQNRPMMEESVGTELARLGVGNSTYDEDIQTMSEAQNIENFRAENQSGLAQVGNGLLKMTTTALTTLADGTIGALYGLGTGIKNLADNDEKTGFWEGMWNNDFNRAMSDIQENMEEIAPNYYTDEQRNSPWYSAANILSANFLGDKLLKNAGFTIGALASLAVPGFDMAWLAKGVTGGAKMLGMSKTAAQNAGAIANYLARTFVSANSEASIEAINAVKDNQKAMYEGIQQRANEDTAQSEQMMMADIASGIDEQTARNNHLQRVRQINSEVNNAKAFADEQLRDVGNSVWLMNTGLLSVTNSLEFGNILKGGYNLRKSLKDFGVKLTAEGKEVGAREFGQALARGVQTSITPEIPKIGAKNVALGTAKNFFSEGFEEGAQRMISDSNQMQAQAKLQQWADDRYNKDSNKYSLWEKQINPTVTADLVDYTKSLTKAWSEGFGTLASSGWEEVFLGGLTGMFGTAGIRQKADGKMGIGWQGGIYEAIKDQQAKYTEADKMITAFNEQLSKPEFKQRMQHSAAALASAYDMEEALNNGDIIGYKNAEMLSVVNDAIYFRDNGMLDLFKGYYEETAKNVSDQTIADLRSQTKDIVTGKSFYDGKTNDEIRQMVQDKSKSTLEKIENTVATYEQMERDYSDKFRGIDIAPYIEDISDPVVKNLVRNSGADYAQRGVQQLTYLSSLHDDLLRRKSELEQERSESENDIDATDKLAKIDKDIKQIDEALNDIKNQFNKAKNNPEEMVQEMIDAQVRSAKVAIGQEAQATKARYHNAQTLQDVADTFLYGNANQSVLEQAIQESTDEDNKNLLKSFYPFSAEVNATEAAIDKVINTNAADEEDEVKNRAKAALGSFTQQAIDETLSERADTGISSTVADKLREYAGNVVAQADQNNPMDMMGAQSTAAFLEEVADELDKARENAKVPEVKPAEAPKKTTESKPQPEPESGKKGEPQDAATQPEPAKKPETKKADTSEAEIKPVETPAPTPTTSAKKVGDSVTLADGFNGTIKSIPKAGVYEVALENGQTGIYTDADLVTGQPETTPEPITQSPTGGNEQNTQVTPNREEEQGKIAKPSYFSSMKNQLGEKKSSLDYYLKDAEYRTKNGHVAGGPSFQGTLQPAIRFAIDSGILPKDFEDVAKGTNVPYDRLVAATQALKKLGINSPKELIDTVEKGQLPEIQNPSTQNPLSEEEQLKILVAWAEGKISRDDAISILKNTKYVKETEGSKVLSTSGGIHFTGAVETDLGKYITDKYPFLNVGNVSVATGTSTFGGDMHLNIVTDQDGVEYGTPSNFIRSLATGGRATEAVKKGDIASKKKEEQGGRFSVNKSAIDKITIDDFVKIHTGLTEAGREHYGNDPDRMKKELTQEVNAVVDYLNGKLSARDYLIKLGFVTGPNSWLDSPKTSKEELQKEVERKIAAYLPYVTNGEAITQEQAAQQAGQQAGESEQETRVTEPDTPEQEEKKEEARSGKSFTGTNFLTYSQTILGRRNPEDKGVAKRRKGDSIKAFQDLLASKGIDIDHVVNNYIYDFMVDGKLPVHYMVMKDDEGKATPKEGSEHIFLVTAITDKIQEFIEKDAKLQGNVKQMSDGSKMLVVGILGYGENDMDLANKAERIREAYRSMDEESKAKEYTVVNVPTNSIYAMNGGQMVLQFEGQERGDVDLKTLLDSNDSTVNPRKLSIGDIRFATAIGKEGEVKLRFFQKKEGDDQYGFNNPLSLQGSPGNVWMFIRNAKGEFIPTPIAPTTWGDSNMNWDSELGRKIRSLVDSLATVTNKEDIPALLKELNQRLVFSINNRNMGNRLFYDDKTGELSFRRFNLDAASDNAKIILGDEESPFLVVDKSESLTINLLNPERPMEESKQILYQMIEALDPVINIQNSVMGSAGGIKMYLDAGLFKVGIKSLGVVNAKTYIYPINDHLEPIDGFVTPPVTPMTAGNLSTFYYNGNRYSFSGEKLYDANFKEVTDPAIIQDIRAAADITAGKVRPIRVNGTSYWEIGGRVYSQYRNGGYAQLTPSEEAEYKQRKAAEADKKAKEQAARDEATRLENLKSTNAKYKVGDDLNGRIIKEVNTVNNEVIYTFDDAQNGIQNGTISQTELDTLLTAEQQNKAANSNKEVHQGKDDSQEGVKKTEQEPKTLAQKVSNSRNNATFASVFKGNRTAFNDLVSAVNNALQKAGEATKQFKGTKALEEELVSRGKPLPTTISELQALVEELNTCGF